MFDPTPADAPSFIRRSRHRNAMSTAASEKLGTTICWTTRSQGELAALFEVTYGVVEYKPWPGPVAVRLGWDQPQEYWPAMSFLTDRGARSFVDVVHPQDEAERAETGFQRILANRLLDEGIGLLTVRRDEVSRDVKVRVGQAVRSFTGWPLHADEARTDLLRIIATCGGSVSFDVLWAEGVRGQTLVATACVLVMRRRLRLSIHRDGFRASSVSLSVAQVAK